MIDGKLLGFPKENGFPYKIRYLGEVLGIEFWESKEDAERFLSKNPGKIFNFKEELIKYNMQDLVLGVTIIEIYGY